MFRRLPHSLPNDPVFPADINLLGYFINDRDQIRQTKYPEQKYQFGVSRNDRVNDVYKGAMNTCIRRIVDKRMTDLGFQTQRLPLGATENDNHVPIWVSADISKKKRVVVYFGEGNQDLGIFSYRVIGDEGIATGSCLEFVQGIQRGPAATTDEEAPGIIIANPAQLHWYRGGQRAVTATEWQSLPRESAVHEPFSIHPVKNRIPGNTTLREHVAYIFDQVLPALVSPEAKIDLIGLEYSGCAAAEYLATNWLEWSSRISGICLCNPQHKVEYLFAPPYNASEEFLDFLSKRCRAYFVSPDPLETIMIGREEFGCNCFSSGEELYQENVIIRCWRSIMDWFNLVHSVPDYAQPELAIVERKGQVEEMVL